MEAWALLHFALFLQLTVAGANTEISINAKENGGTVTHQLPSDLLAEDFRSVCFPERAEYYDIAADGLVSFRPKRGAFSLNDQDQDSSFIVGVNKTENGDAIKVVTPLIEVKIHIQPSNQAPVAAEGTGRVLFNKPQYILTPHNFADYDQRMKLEPPFSLLGELPAVDPDGDQLRYAISVPPRNGTASKASGNKFFYVPDAGFAGIDQFTFEVGESQGIPTPLDPIVPVKVFHSGQGRGSDGETASAEESALVSAIERTSSLNPEVAASLRYQLTNETQKGAVEFLCGGKEVYDPHTCSTETDDESLEPQAYYKYSPESDAEGDDGFQFQMRLEGQSSVAPVSGSVALNVLRVNQAPRSFDAQLQLPLHYPVEPFTTGGYTNITLRAEDSETNFLLGLIDMREIWSGAGQLFSSIGDGTDDNTAMPVDTIVVDGVEWGQVDFVNGDGVVYFKPSPRIAAEGLLRIVYKVFDGELYSSLATVIASISCTPGYYMVPYDGAGQAPEHLPTLHSCKHCPPGTMAYVNDQQNCISCGSGSFSVGAAGDCTLCPRGYYQEAQGSQNCTQCPDMSSSDIESKSVQDCFCLSGSYGEGGQCHKCPEKWVDCGEEKLQAPLPLKGQWVSRVSQDVALVRSCLPREACIGFDRKTDPALTITQYHVLQGMTCKKGYKGEACGKCSSGYYRSVSYCKKCPSWLVLIIRWALYLIVLCTPVMARFYGPMHWMALYIVVLFSQPISLLARYHIEWPDNFRGYLEVISVLCLDVDFLALECIGSPLDRFAAKWWFIMLLPCGALIFSTIGGTIWWASASKKEQAKISRYSSDDEYMKPGSALFQKFASKKEEDSIDTAVDVANVFEQHATIVSWICSLLLAYALLLQVPLSTGALMLFDCFKDGPTGSHFMEAAPDIKCYNISGVWGRLAAPGILFVCLYVFGIPAYMMHVGMVAKRKTSSEVFYQKYFSFILGSFNPESRSFIIYPVFTLMTLCLLMLGNTLTKELEVLKMVLMFLILMLYHNFLLSRKPLRSSQRMNLCCSLLMTALGLLVLSGIAVASPLAGTGFLGLVFTVNAIMIAFTYIGVAMCLGWLLSPLCRDVEVWLKNIWMEQQQMQAMPKRRKGMKKPTWGNTVSKFKKMHAFLGAMRGNRTGMAFNTDSSKSQKVQVL